MFNQELFFLSVCCQRVTVACHGSLRKLPGFGTVTGNGSVHAHPRPRGAVEFCRGLGASEQPPTHDGLYREVMSEKHINSHTIDGRKESDREIYACKRKAASLTSFIGYDPLLH